MAQFGAEFGSVLSSSCECWVRGKEFLAHSRAEFGSVLSSRCECSACRRAALECSRAALWRSTDTDSGESVSL